MTTKLCRWGILGAANIARKNWKAIRNSGNGTLVAVASRSQDRAEQFIRECQRHVPYDPTPLPIGSYEDLLKRPDIDAVYIPLPTGIRKDWVIRAAEAGKHVLCEKPCAINAADLREMLVACQKQPVQFMDGVMFMHSQRLPKLREVLADGESVGTIRRICSQFSFCAPEAFTQQNIRVSSELEPLGCLGDLGWYNIRFSLWVMNYQMPERVTGRILSSHGRPDSPAPVPMEFEGALYFRGGVSAPFYCSFITENQQWANVSGTKGFAHLSDFVLSFYGAETGFDVTNAVFYSDGCDFNMERHTRRVSVREYSNSFPNAQETQMMRTFAQHVLSGQIDPLWGEIALKTQVVMEACLDSAAKNGEMLPVRW